MKTHPLTCTGCVLDSQGTGFMEPALATDGYQVALVGEALGREEAEVSAPFVGKAGLRLTRLLEWAGFDRNRFDIWNTVWCRPPHNQLEGMDYEHKAISHCRQQHWDRLLDRVRVLVPMGNVALNALTGRKGILRLRGYIQPGPQETHLVPTVHPSFIQRGQSKYSAAFIYDIQKAVRLAHEGMQFHPKQYLIDPSPEQALRWAMDYTDYLTVHPTVRVAYDIETPYKGDDEEDLGRDWRDNFIWRIGFSYRRNAALTVPWTPPYLPAIRHILESEGEKVVWNAGFDTPIIRANGVDVCGVIHDGMVAWHILHSDLPKKLEFVATFTCPHQSAWKHLSGRSPGLYNCIDADVEYQSMEVIEEELREVGLWEVYERDVLALEPILVHMHDTGMPIDATIRCDRAERLAHKQEALIRTAESTVPVETRAWSPKHGYKKPPKDTTGLISIRVEDTVRRCTRCGVVSPPKSHFKTYKRPTTKRPQNPCHEAGSQEQREVVERYARLTPFKISREQLVRYQEFTKRPVPTIFDKKTQRRKVTMDRKAVQKLAQKYPTDPLYQAVLEYRVLDKIAGTYIGRPVEEECSKEI